MFCLTVDDEIKLGLLEERHAEQLFKIVDANRAYLRQWLPWLDANTTAADTAKFIKQSQKQFIQGEAMQTTILFQQQMVGMAGYNSIDWSNRLVSLGYWLSADFQGRGIVTRACRFLVTYAFKELGLNRAEIRCATGNQPSQGVPKRLGFVNEGVIRHAEFLYDHMIDHVVYGMLAAEWPE